MDYKGELTAVQTWIKQTAGLNSWRRSKAPPALPRPVAVWDSPFRGRDKNLDRYTYEQKVVFYGTLFVNDLNESLQLQDTLITALENQCGIISLLDSTGISVGYLKNASFSFTDVEGLDVPFTLTYYVVYKRKRPTAPSSAKRVHTRITSNKE